MWTILILASIAAASAEPRTFIGEKVFRVFPQNYAEVQLIKSLDEHAKLDFWVPDSVDLVEPGKSVDFRAESHVVYDVQAMLEQSGMSFKIIIDDLQVALDKQRDSSSRAVHSYEKYNNLDTINAWSANIAAQNPSLVSRSQIGTSYQGRPLYLLKVGKSGANKKAIFIDCGIHAREWISPAFCQWFVKEAVNSYGSDAQFTNLLNNLDFYVLPVMNVDGYEYSWTTYRMWRKTLSANKNSACLGTDLNRNFNAGWCTVGASKRACDETYCGTVPESEKEAKALADFIRANIDSIKGYLTIHSYGQMLLFPYSYTYNLAKDHDELYTVARNAVSALTSLYGTQYTYGPGAATIYYNGTLDYEHNPFQKNARNPKHSHIKANPAAGGSDDWAYDAGVKYSYTFELRDKYEYGFALPEIQIKPTCEETMLAVKYIANYILNNA